jgi:cellulose synthase/poly-beta-1,6-N-acetylglucosamine synthase-like glycosyltransferase
MSIRSTNRSFQVVRPGGRPPLVRETARTLMSSQQKIVVSLLLGLLAADAIFMGPIHALIVLIAVCQIFYLAFVGLKLVLGVASINHKTPSTSNLPGLDDPTLPVVTILVPLFDEAEVVRRLVRALDRLQYPKHLLQELLLLEEVDQETKAAIRALRLPAHFQAIVVPDMQPRTKPKACDVGLAYARGDLCVIYDGEDRPDPYQLLKAVAAFRQAPPDVACVQSVLQFWNLDTNLITRMYWVEYVFHFRFILTGMARLGLTPPLGGTSNVFRTEALHRIAVPPQMLRKGGLDPDVLPIVAAWDPWNVAEDADIAGALARAGYKIWIIDSYTLEEASHRARVATRQRARWGKGYFQSGLVHTRRPLTAMRQMGRWNFAVYNLTMIGTPISLMINPIFWGLTIAYLAARQTWTTSWLAVDITGVAVFIEHLFPPAIFYAGVFTAVVGNFVLFYALMLACLSREEHGNVKYMFLVPFWWAFSSYAMWKGVLELARRSTRSHWHKTPHGHDAAREEDVIERLMDQERVSTTS